MNMNAFFIAVNGDNGPGTWENFDCPEPSRHLCSFGTPTFTQSCASPVGGDIHLS